MTDARDVVALVVAAHGRRGIVEIDGARRPYVAKGRQLRVVCGDRVRCEQPAGSDAVLVTAIERRENTLSRAAPRGTAAEVIAANLTQLVVVCAPAPRPDLFLTDRYLCAAEIMGCRPAVAWNKCELDPEVPAEFDCYRALGYPIVALSARTGLRIADLCSLLEAHTSVLVGQSGVGKSSLVNAVAPGAAAAVGELSSAAAVGTHTTTAVLMYRIGDTGRLVDTPGVRDFIPAITRDMRLEQGFPEVRARSRECRFANCEHDHEPGCAVKTGVDEGCVPRRRYDSYLRLLRMTRAERG